MKNIIQQFISQIEEDQSLLPNTKTSYKSDLKELLEYSVAANTQPHDINQEWVRNYLRHLESTNKERNSFNRRASTFRIFLRFLYKNKLAPTNYSLIVSNLTTFEKTQNNELETEDIRKIIEDTKLKPEQKLILQLIGKIGLTATQIVSLNTFQVDFENKLISLSDSERIYLPQEVFISLREYLLEVRSNIPEASESLSLFLNESGKPLTEADIYKMIKKISEDLSLQGKFTTRSLKKSAENKIDILSMQKEVFGVISPR